MITLYLIVHQIEVWAAQLHEGKFPIDSIISGMSEMARDIRREIEIGESNRMDLTKREESLIKEARERCSNLAGVDIEVDDDATLFSGDNGDWVSVWVWVPVFKEDGE